MIQLSHFLIFRKKLFQKDTCTPVSIAALFTIAKTWKQTASCPSADEWVQKKWYIYNGIFSLVAQSCPTLCDPTNHSMPGLPVHHKLPEFTQTHVHRVGDAIQSSHSAIKRNVLSHFSRVRLFTTPWTVAHQAPLSMGSARQEYWSGLPCPSPEKGMKQCHFQQHRWT